MLLVSELNKVINFFEQMPGFSIPFAFENIWQKFLPLMKKAFDHLHLLLAYYCFQGNITNWKHSIAIFWRYLKVITKMFVKKQQKPTDPPLSIHQMFKCFVITLLKWMKYKNRSTFAYYSINHFEILKDFKVFQKPEKC